MARKPRISPRPSLAVPAECFGQGAEPLLQREWLVTNGLGGYASGTVAGAGTRRYHGLLVAADPAPNARWVLVSGADFSAVVEGNTHALSTQEYPDGVLSPAGFGCLRGFQLHGQRPVWRWRAGDAEIEQTLWMPYGANRTFIRFQNDSAGMVRLCWRPFVTLRWFHALLHDEAVDFEVDMESAAAVRIQAPWEAPALSMGGAGWSFQPSAHWYRNFTRRAESARGFDYLEHAFSPGVFEAELAPGAARVLELAGGAEELGKDPEASLQDFDQRATSLAAEANSDLERHLRLAADQFLVQRGRPLPGQSPAPNTTIAGYPWFGDWGRDTLIALPGLCLATDRHEAAKSILLSYAGFVDRGMVPNRWPDAGEAPEYTAADAALWFLYALERYVAASSDTEVLEVLATAIVDVIDWHVRGTRHGIGVDPADGLLSAGADGLQLTWMDAKTGDWVVTPRRGKPVEINALWCGALQFALCALEQIGWRGVVDRDLAETAQASFARRFWNEAQGCLFDVIDGPQGNDPAIRPNQIVAVALNRGLLERERALRVVEVVERELLTPVGLRSLERNDPAYRPAYTGNPQERDGAYHQGPVWSWLLGMFVDAKLAVGSDRAGLRRLLEGMRRHLTEGCVGSVNEIFQPEPAFAPDGAIAQAWGVAEWLRIAQAIAGPENDG